MVSFVALRPEQVEALQKVQLPWQPRHDAVIYDVGCRYRGCSNDGIYYMRRELKNGSLQSGLFCHDHEVKFGEQNLRRWAHSLGARVELLEDEEGTFRGVDYKG